MTRTDATEDVENVQQEFLGIQVRITFGDHHGVFIVGVLVWVGCC